MKRGSPLKRTRRDTGPDAATRRALAERSGGWCEARIDGCDGRATDVHHRLGRKAGGRRGEAAERLNALSALLHLCRACHLYVTSPYGERRQFALDTGLVCLEHDDPAETPVTLPQHGPVYLKDDGGRWPADLTPIDTTGEWL